MKFQNVARFEFRVFGDDLTGVRTAFAARGPGARQPPSRETYIVTRLNIESNVKVRSDRLEVKGLQGRLLMLEQWVPVLKSSFPVPAEEIEDVVAPALGIDLVLGRTPPLSLPALLALAAAQPALATIVVDKVRTLFDLGDCEAEFCELRLGEDRLQTVAVEAVEAGPAQTLLREAGLDGAQNESYALFLQRRLFPAPR